VRTKVWLEIDGQFAIGEHGLELLAAVEQTGSLAAAARTQGWSYRHAWGYVRRAESVLGGALLISRSGKGACRGAILSPLARAVLTFKAAKDS
jgi:molybdate transport system regulatory protein